MGKQATKPPKKEKNGTKYEQFLILIELKIAENAFIFRKIA
jgi:hypothetical protein